MRLHLDGGCAYGSITAAAAASSNCCQTEESQATVADVDEGAVDPGKRLDMLIRC